MCSGGNHVVWSVDGNLHGAGCDQYKRHAGPPSPVLFLLPCHVHPRGPALERARTTRRLFGIRRSGIRFAVVTNFHSLSPSKPDAVFAPRACPGRYGAQPVMKGCLACTCITFVDNWTTHQNVYVLCILRYVYPTS